MKESEPMLETRLYRCGWIFLFILCVWKIAKKMLFPHFVLSFGTRPCVFYTLTGYFCPGCGGNPKSSGIAFRENFRECGGFSRWIFYAPVVFAWFMISQTIDRISGHRLPIGMKYRDTWVYAALVIVVIHFVVKNLFYIKTGVEPFL